jgi:hypothetical protein
MKYATRMLLLASGAALVAAAAVAQNYPGPRVTG